MNLLKLHETSTPFLVPIGLELEGTSPDYKPVVMRENWRCHCVTVDIHEGLEVGGTPGHFENSFGFDHFSKIDDTQTIYRK